MELLKFWNGICWAVTVFLLAAGLITGVFSADFPEFLSLRVLALLLLMHDISLSLVLRVLREVLPTPPCLSKKDGRPQR